MKHDYFIRSDSRSPKLEATRVLLGFIRHQITTTLGRRTMMLKTMICKFIGLAAGLLVTNILLTSSMNGMPASNFEAGRAGHIALG